MDAVNTVVAEVALLIGQLVKPAATTGIFIRFTAMSLALLTYFIILETLLKMKTFTNDNIHCLFTFTVIQVIYKLINFPKLP